MMRSASSLLLASALCAGCSVKLLADESVPSLANRCSTAAECGAGATCTDGACFAQTGTIDDVVLEMVRDASSGSAVVTGLPYLSQQSGVAAGVRDRVVQLPGLAEITGGAVQTSAALPDACPHQMQSVGGVSSVAARIEFERTGDLGGVPILGIPSVATSVDTSLNPSFSYKVSLVPGTYDIYVEPDAACKLAPWLVLGLDIAGTIDPKLPPAILPLPDARTLKGKVVRNDPAPSATLSDWTVCLIEPRNGRRVSTISPLGQTDTGDHTTTFEQLLYQPVFTPTGTAPSASLLIEIAPPPNLVAPTLYWDLAAVDINGTGSTDGIGLDMSGLPTPDQLVTVTGTVRVGSTGVPAYIYFDTSSLEQSAGLIASFSAEKATDAAGHYSVSLYPGQYRAIAVPAAEASAAGSSPWAITDGKWTVPSTGASTHDITLSEKRNVTGTATLTTTGEPAHGAVVQSDASLDPTQITAFRARLAKTPVLPTSASAVVLEDGTFSLALDPGTVDLSVRPPDGSDLAWWVRPALPISSSSVSVTAPLAPPVPFEGRVVDATGTSAGSLLITAYARAPKSSVVTKVGYARTDGGGAFKLRIPASFGP
jgi:hypothetical protein